MPDDKSKLRPQDASRVNVHEPYEVEYWCHKFGCTHQQLIQAVNAVGTSAAAVERYLKGK